MGVVYELFIDFRIVWGHMELSEENGLLAEMQANYALSLAKTLIELSGDEVYTPRVEPYLLMGDVHAALQVKGSDIKGSRQDSAIKSYEAALSIPDPTDNYGINHAKIMLKLADAYMKFEQPHKALHYFSRCITTTTDTSTQLMKIAKGQRLNSPLHWIEINGNSRLKADFEDEFVGVDQHIHDTILTVRELTAECGRGLNKIPPGQASIEND